MANPKGLLKQGNAFELVDELFKHAKTPTEQRDAINLFLQAVRGRVVSSGLIISEMQLAFMDLDKGKVSAGWLKPETKRRGEVGDSQKGEFNRLAAVACVVRRMDEADCSANAACKHVAKLIGSKQNTVQKWYDRATNTRDFKAMQREVGRWDNPDQALSQLWKQDGF